MKTIRLPYLKYKNFIFVKQIDYNTSRHYKKICYLYEVYDDKKEKTKDCFHRTDGPAIVIYNNNYISQIEYWKHGNRHRENGPAILRLDKKHTILSEEWYINNIKLTQTEIDDIKLIIDRRKKMYKVILKMQSKKLIYKENKD